MSAAERSTEQHQLHFDLGAHATGATFTLNVAGQEYPLDSHTAHTLKAARAGNGLLRLLPDNLLSHHATVAMPADAVALAWVTTPVLVDGMAAERVVSMAIHMPRQARLRDVHRLRGSQSDDVPARQHPKLARLLRNRNMALGELQVLAAAPDQLADYNEAYETAVALLFHHPEIMNLNAQLSHGGTQTVIETCIRDALDEYTLLVDMIADHPGDWSTVERVFDDGKPAFDDQGAPVFTMGLHADVLANLAKPVAKALVLVKQAEDLRGQNWSVQTGHTEAAYAGQVEPRHAHKLRAPRGAGDVRWRLKNLTPSDGLVFEPDVRFTPGAPGGSLRAEGIWSHDEGKEAGPFDETARQSLNDGQLYLVVNGLSAVPLTPTDFAGRYRILVESAGRRVQGECVLNSDGDALQYTITLTGHAFRSAYFAIGTPPSLRQAHNLAVRDVGNSGSLMIVVKNYWLRHLSAYVEFLDGANRVIVPPNWESRFPVLSSVYDAHPSKRYVDMVGPVETMMGIPLSADSSHLSVPVPADAAMIRFIWGGLGSGRGDPVACPAGAVMTVVIEMALPTLLLAAGAGLTASGGLMKIIKQKPVIGGLLVGFTGLYIGLSENPGKAVLTVVKKLIPVIAKAGLGQLSTFIAQKISESAAKKAIPFFNLAMLVADAAATMAQLAQTNCAIRQAPRAHVTEVTRSIDLNIVITSSKLYHKYPDHHHHISVVVAYDSGATLPSLVKPLPPETISDDIIVSFTDVPAAGNLRVLVFFYAENGWQSGQGASAWTRAEGSQGRAVLDIPAIEIDINEIPLGTWSTYQHQEKIVLRGRQRVWQAAPAPEATASTSSPYAGAIVERQAITVAQYPEMIGYAWQSSRPDMGALYSVQNLSVLQDPQAAYARTAADSAISGGIVYDVVSSDDGRGRNFFLDPSAGVYDEQHNPAGGFHLRRVPLQYKHVPHFEPARDQSWGRFPDGVHSMAVHPNGYVFGIRRGTHKLYRIALADAAIRDDQAPMATLSSGEGRRTGLLDSPIAVALAIDGRVLVLEAGSNHRVQCFDINGNPVSYFTDPTTKATSAVMPLRRKKTHLLDMAVEAKGYIFILGHTGSGNMPTDYYLDLYDPAGAFLTSTAHFTAARITVDLLRNLFALNYETLQGDDGRVEPGISHWRPVPPPRTQAEGETA